uniref:Uncharacterized protein n=1 Tax=Sinocyclocheilus anshuiensis TaxID=1608454 RepID=A0A671Q3I5_9TELE
MSVNVPAPAMFLPCPGEPSMPFDMWLRMFQNYLLVIIATGDAWPDARKRATLLHCLGREGQRIFYALPETGDTYASAISALQKHFTPKVNVVVERYTIAQYVAALRAHAATCGFEDKADDMIRDQLLEHLCSDSIREGLLLESDLTLDTAVTLATQMECITETFHSKSQCRRGTLCIQKTCLISTQDYSTICSCFACPCCHLRF